MIKHIWTVVCSKSTIDKDTNNISLNDVLERLDVVVSKNTLEKKQSVSIPINFEIVSLFQRDKMGREESFDMKIKVKDPKDNKIRKTLSAKITFQAQFLRMRSRTRIRGFNLTVSGNYIFEVSMRNNGEKTFKKVAEIPLEVHLKIKQDQKIKAPLLSN